MGADMGRHAAGDFRHGREQRQRALRAGHRLVGDRGDAGRQQIFGLRAVGSEVQVGEEDLAAVKLFAFSGQRLFHFHDQFGAAEYLISVLDDLGAGSAIIRVG
jgi:hypothetical protein